MPIEKYLNGAVGVRHKSLPPEVFDPLVELATWQEARKRNFSRRSGGAFPAEIDAAATHVARMLGGRSNFACIKRYDVDGYQSQAYQAHTDPVWFRGGRLITLSLTNVAIMTVVGDETVPILCAPNTLIDMDPLTQHKVTPPLEEGPRHVVFFGSVLGQ